MTTTTERGLSGWGREPPSRALVTGPLDLRQLGDLIVGAPAGGVLARGAGRSYGDAAQNGGGVVLNPGTARLIEPDPEHALVRVSASVTFTELLACLVPLGLFPP